MTGRPTAALVSPDTFRRAISHHACGVAIVTTLDAGTPVGLTVSTVTSHSVEPPTLSCDLALSSRVLPAVRSQARFAVQLLDQEQADIALRFANRDVDRFASTAWSWWEGLPAIDGVLASFACDLLTDVEVGDHAIVLGTVAATEVNPQRRPLIHQERGFHHLA